MIQQRAVAVRRRLQLVQQIGERLHVQFVDLDDLGDLFLIVLMVGDRVVPVRDADGAVAAVAAFTRHHETDYAGHVRLESDDDQVAHYLGVLLELVGDAGGPFQQRQLHCRALFFRFLNAAFNVANAVQILGQLALVARAQSRLQTRDVSTDEIEDASILLHHLQTGGGIVRFPISEEALEHRARVDLHRIRRGGGAPGNGVGIGAAITGIAASREVRLFEADLERCELRVLTESPGCNLVGRNAGLDVGAFRLLRMNAGQPTGACARVVARSVTERSAAVLHEVAHHQQLLAEWFQRLHGGGEVKASAHFRGEPRFLNDAVRDIDEP